MTPEEAVVIACDRCVTALAEPVIRAWWRGHGLGNVVELRVAGRQTRLPPVPGTPRQHGVRVVGRQHVGGLVLGDAGFLREVAHLVVPGGIERRHHHVRSTDD